MTVKRIGLGLSVILFIQRFIAGPIDRRKCTVYHLPFTAFSQHHAVRNICLQKNVAMPEQGRQWHICGNSTRKNNICAEEVSKNNIYRHCYYQHHVAKAVLLYNALHASSRSVTIGNNLCIKRVAGGLTSYLMIFINRYRTSTIAWSRLAWRDSIDLLNHIPMPTCRLLCYVCVGSIQGRADVGTSSACVLSWFVTSRNL
ncbi:hypothetical protein GGS21DRAFT_262790 [Xylaria nigripes]|nr:hypothetical protein GGS21DRAFT_262790 [Xylaria nigripes]